MKAENKKKADTKKQYSKPKLTVHGTLTEITRGGTDGDRESLTSSLRSHS